MPYSRVIGNGKAGTREEGQIKLALELAYIDPHIRGVLLSGHRGTGKSTVVRAFARMMYNELPITLPINATEDRVVGGLDIDQLMQNTLDKQKGLLQLADNKLLYVDEINLLDDHIVNIILDVTSTGILDIQREHMNEPPVKVSFVLIGTMNPEEGGLRPQLLDRFGLMADIDTDDAQRSEVLWAVLQHDTALFEQEQGDKGIFIEEGYRQDRQKRKSLMQAQDRLHKVKVSKEIVQDCVTLTKAFDIEGYRGDYILALAARALAAHDGVREVTQTHLKQMAPLALVHRMIQAAHSDRFKWTKEHDNEVEKCLPDA
ncbi:MAG: AAA domain-containing protein [Gammaproteobacteria bacterium]|nr:AAA domain-containing protein [Gammaproteobacteria bacterium]